MLPPELREGILLVATHRTLEYLGLYLVARAAAGRVVGLGEWFPVPSGATASTVRASLINCLGGMRCRADCADAIRASTSSPVTEQQALDVLAAMLVRLGLGRESARRALALTARLADLLVRHAQQSIRQDNTLSLAMSLVGGPLPSSLPKEVEHSILATARRMDGHAGAAKLDASCLAPAARLSPWRAGLAYGDPGNPFLRLATTALCNVRRAPVTLQVTLPPDLGDLLIITASPEAPCGAFQVVPAAPAQRPVRRATP